MTVNRINVLTTTSLFFIAEQVADEEPTSPTSPTSADLLGSDDVLQSDSDDGQHEMALLQPTKRILNMADGEDNLVEVTPPATPVTKTPPQAAPVKTPPASATVTPARRQVTPTDTAVAPINIRGAELRRGGMSGVTTWNGMVKIVGRTKKSHTFAFDHNNNKEGRTSFFAVITGVFADGTWWTSTAWTRGYSGLDVEDGLFGKVSNFTFFSALFLPVHNVQPYTNSSQAIFPLW